MRNPSTPSPVIDVRDTATPTEDPTPRAEQALPPMFHPSPLAAPALRAHQQTALEYAAETLGEMRLAADMIALPRRGRVSDADRTLAAQVSTEAGRLQRLLKALAAGALGLAVLAGVVAGPSAGHAEAATVAPAVASVEGPEPDPIAPATYRVTLGARPVTVYVRAQVYTPVAPGWWCGSVFTATGLVGRTCSIGSIFSIPVRIDPRTFPIGRTFAQVVDDATDLAVGNLTFDARRPSAFQLGTWLDMGRGDLYVRAPLTMYSAPVGRYIAQQYSPVQVQVAGRRGWVTVATLNTGRYGVASGIVHVGGGVRNVRVVRPAGSTVWSTTGTTRRVIVTTEPLDVD